MTWNSHYALSLLLMELSSEVLITQQIEKNDIPMQMLTIIEWIRIHYEQPLTVAGIAERFNYHPTYLTGLFKKYTGYPLMTYINRVRITISKNLLTDQAYKVSTVARLCGFTDEKYFMKLFKRYEGMTPSQYRNTFHQKKDEPDLRHDFSRLVQKIRQVQAVPDLTDFYITFLTFYAVYTVILHPG